MLIRAERQVRRHNKDILSIFFNKNIYCVFLLDRLINAILISTHNIPFSKQKIKKITLNYPKFPPMGFVPWDSRTSSKQPW